MSFFSNSKISTKIIIVSTILAFIFLGAVPFYVSIRAQTIFSDTLLSVAREDVEIAAGKLGITIDDARNDILAISKTPPILGIERAKLNEGLDELEGSTEEQWKSRLATIFTAFQKSKPYYNQLRLIDVTGQEIVRVDLPEGGVSKRVKDEDLQNKYNREYFNEAIKLEEDQVFVSYPSLNKEGDPPKIEIPYNPVIRIATPLFGLNGERIGILIANANFDLILRSFDFHSSEYESSFIVDDKGQYILHIDKSKEWGGEDNLDNGEGIQKDFHNLSNDILTFDSGEIETEDGLFVLYKKVIISDLSDQFLVFVTVVSKNSIFDPFTDLFYQSSVIGLIVFIILFFVFRYFINRLLEPLKNLSTIAREIGQGNFDQRIKVESNDEIGQLSQVVNATSEQLKILYSDLDNLIKQKTRELLVAKKRLEIATKSADIGIWDWDIKSNKLQWNNEMYELYGVDKEKQKDIYKVWEESIHPDDIDRTRKELQYAVDGKKDYNTDFRIVTPNGLVRYVRAYGVGLKNKKGQVLRMIGVNWDITEQKEIEKAKDEFISVASHQLKTPLASVRWLTDILLAGDAGKLTAKQKEFISDIRETNHRMNDLVKMLLNVSRIELETFAIKPEPTDLGKLANSVVKDLQPLIHKKKVKVTKRFQKGLPKVKVDPQFMRMIFQNLISNAVKYNIDGGKVLVNAIKDGRNIMIKISDTGLGIPKDQQNSIFTKLFRANNVLDKNIEGNGLGLYIIKTVIEEVKGKIWFESEEGKGTTFFVSIPATGMKQKKGTRSLG